MTVVLHVCGRKRRACLFAPSLSPIFVLELMTWLLHDRVRVNVLLGKEGTRNRTYGIRDGGTAVGGGWRGGRHGRVRTLQQIGKGGGRVLRTACNRESDGGFLVLHLEVSR